MNPEFRILIDNFIIYVVPPAFSLITAYTVYLINKLRIKVKEKNGDHALSIFDKVVDTVVLSLNQTVVDDFKKGMTEKINKEASEYLKNVAKYRIEKTIAKEIKKNVKSVIKDYDKYIDNAIEAKVNQFKIKKNV